jgi:hypothetical protein
VIDTIGPRKMGPIQKIKRAASEDEEGRKSKRSPKDSSEETRREERKGIRIDDRA